MVGAKVFAFQGKKTASKALDTIEDHAPVYAWADDVAVVSRSKHGFIKVNSTWAQDDDAVSGGGGWGALTGGLIGALAGPAGALAGAIGGGSVGGLMGTGINVAIDDPRLDAFAKGLDKDTSALILVAEKATLADFYGAVEPLGGVEVVDTELNEEDVKALRKALKD